MASYFFSTKAAGKSTHPLPDSLTNDEVLQILHNHSVLSQIFWPHSTAKVRIQPSSMSNKSNFLVEQNSMEFKASVCSQPNGVTCTEELPLGLKVAITYVIASRDQLAEEQSAYSEKGEVVSTLGSLNSSPIPLDHQLYLIEEKYLTGFKPIANRVKGKQNTCALRTQNLVKVFEELGGPRKDLVSALSQLNGIATRVNADITSGKAKNE